MSDIKIKLPSLFTFSTRIPVRITDINYSGHVGNDSVLSIIHEARMQYLHQFAYSELKFEGTGLIMRNVVIEYKKELFYGDTILASVSVGAFTKVSFNVYYKLEKDLDGKTIRAAVAQTEMVCYNFGTKRIAPVPEEAKVKLLQ